MDERLNILGLDAGFANIGWAVISVDRHGHPRPVDAGCIRTRKTRVTTVSDHDDTARRARDIWTGVQTLMVQYRPVASCLESISWPHRIKPASAGKLGVGWGCILGCMELHQVPLVQIMPKALKKSLTGKMTASKEEVEDAVKAIDGFEDFEDLIRSLPIAGRDHSFDAAGAVLACLDSHIIRAVLSAHTRSRVEVS